MAIRGLTAAVVVLLSAATSGGQSLVATTSTPFKVAASYGYSQVHHDGEWIRIDVGVTSERNGTMRLHKAFSLLTPGDERIDLPSQQEYRAGFDEINAMKVRATLQLSPWFAIPGCKELAYPSWTDEPRRSCNRWRLWGNGGVDWAVSVGPGHGSGGVALYFHSPDGWPAGEYWLEVDGPGDLEARLPVRLH